LAEIYASSRFGMQQGRRHARLPRGAQVASSVVVMSRMSDQVGRVLSGRYRLLAPIGSGASAQVYLADDTRLRRRVAVKLLHAGLADDEAFLRRFRAEAQAAAALNHPHIVAVFDWSDDTGGGAVPYLVTEYLGGGSLRGILDAGKRLTPAQALVVGLEATRALDFAHRRGFVHRDIKPANLLFGEEGRLRIADFGLARALAEAAWTEPAGAVLGTARYASPEQARGELVDGRADVYSLALVLIEAVTGTVPFAADTTIGTLMARVERPVEVPAALGPLRPVLERAGRPQPDDRPDAGDFAVGLMAAAEDLDRPTPLPLVGATPHLGAGVDEHRDHTLLPPGTGGTDVTVVSPVGTDVATATAAATSAVDAEPPRRRRRRWPWIVVAILLVGALAAGAAYAWTELRVPSHDVPSFLGLTEEQAQRLADENGWEVERREGREDGSTPGDVIGQEPDEGVSLKEGETVALTISLGNELTDVPTDLVGKPLADAQAAVEAAGLRLADPQFQFDETVPADVVLALAEGTPAQLPKGDPVTLIVSGGPAPRTVPDVPAGSTYEQAAAAVTGVQLVPARVDEFSDTVPANQVIRLDPSPGTEVPRDSQVNVVVSKGPELIPVPDVTGKSVPEATQILQAAGFVVDGVVGNPTKEVLATSPPAGEPHPRGTKVVLLARV
jgi:serine/threonine-protein kinase